MSRCFQTTRQPDPRWTSSARRCLPRSRSRLPRDPSSWRLCRTIRRTSLTRLRRLRLFPPRRRATTWIKTSDSLLFLKSSRQPEPCPRILPRGRLQNRLLTRRRRQWQTRQHRKKQRLKSQNQHQSPPLHHTHRLGQAPRSVPFQQQRMRMATGKKKLARMTFSRHRRPLRRLHQQPSGKSTLSSKPSRTAWRTRLVDPGFVRSSTITFFGGERGR